MECLPVGRLPEGPEWVYELKLDGYRAQAIRETKGVRLYSRNGKDYNKKFPQVVAELSHAIGTGTAIDGELVALDKGGRPSFSVMQNAGPDSQVIFFAFDVLSHQGKDLKALPLRDRLAILKIAFTASGNVQFSETFPGPALSFVTAVWGMGGEGIVAKRLNSRYEPGKRSGAWQKMRINVGQEFVIGGFTPGAYGFDAVIVGFYEKGKPIYVARVRAGFVPSLRRELYARLAPLISDKCPFANLPEASAGRWGQGLTAKKMKECIWVRPEVVAQFEFLEWTGSNQVRHIKYVGLRDDKDPKKVTREDVIPYEK
jgi:bifunctional non-homologous end joining protein LigD